MYSDPSFMGSSKPPQDGPDEVVRQQFDAPEMYHPARPLWHNVSAQDNGPVSFQVHPQNVLPIHHQQETISLASALDDGNNVDIQEPVDKDMTKDADVMRFTSQGWGSGAFENLQTAQEFINRPLCGPNLPDPVGRGMTFEDIEQNADWYRKALYQNMMDFSAVRDRNRILAFTKFSNDEIQARVWELFDSLVQYYKRGPEVWRQQEQQSPKDKKLSFYDRFVGVCSALKSHKLICIDVMQGKGKELVHRPYLRAESKETNQRTNFDKKKKKEDMEKAAAAAASRDSGAQQGEHSRRRNRRERGSTLSQRADQLRRAPTPLGRSTDSRSASYYPMSSSRLAGHNPTYIQQPASQAPVAMMVPPTSDLSNPPPNFGQEYSGPQQMFHQHNPGPVQMPWDTFPEHFPRQQSAGQRGNGSSLGHRFNQTDLSTQQQSRAVTAAYSPQSTQAGVIFSQDPFDPNMDFSSGSEFRSSNRIGVPSTRQSFSSNTVTGLGQNQSGGIVHEASLTYDPLPAHNIDPNMLLPVHPDLLERSASSFALGQYGMTRDLPQEPRTEGSPNFHEILEITAPPKLSLKSGPSLQHSENQHQPVNTQDAAESSNISAGDHFTSIQALQHPCASSMSASACQSPSGGPSGSIIKKLDSQTGQAMLESVNPGESTLELQDDSVAPDITFDQSFVAGIYSDIAGIPQEEISAIFNYESPQT
ncbi:hypothetical protein K402DRAFT_460608 [Aulographum hederae CBS 113979]|uniref:Uncharacterized protein n=1 Tax=Aulographum hederae CBS 113979 TaxID=1176131 RepID=A0A6G1HBW3_9PEZI|nr:hypothetical protein K402DRAFT_460608 [Aulographum hederae CBS 113979]